MTRGNRLVATALMAGFATAASTTAHADAVPNTVVVDCNIFGGNNNLPLPGGLLVNNQYDGNAARTWCETGSAVCAGSTGFPGTVLAAGYPLNTPINARWIANVNFLDNREVDPTLVDIAGGNLTPLLGSPALDGTTVAQQSLLDPWFDDACFQGAFAYTLGTRGFIQGWVNEDPSPTAWNTVGSSGYIPPAKYAVTEMKFGALAGNETWTADRTWIVMNRVSVPSGITLTIDAGTYVVGNPDGAAVLSYLVVERGGTLIVNGTAQAPVVFTSGKFLNPDPILGLRQDPGDWGGVVMHGRARSNCRASTGACGETDDTANGHCQSEGDAGIFGGTNDDDNSGSIQYARFEYSGRELAPNNELNSFTMNGVGRQTVLQYLQAFNGTDDGFEWFGGTARCKYLYAVANTDDQLDWQMGYRGRVQFAVGRTLAGIPYDRGIEADNNEFNFSCTLESDPIFTNLTLTGAGTQGIELRRGTNGTIVNSIVVNNVSVGLRMSDFETVDNGVGPAPAKFVNCTAATAAQPAVAGFAVHTFPNPTIGQSTFAFYLPASEAVAIRVFDAAGRLVDTVVNRTLDAGSHTLAWTPRGEPAGVYFYQVKTSNHVASGKIMVID